MTAETIVAELRAAAPRAPESLRERVAASAPQQRLRTVHVSRRLFLVVPAAATALVVAAVVVGVVGSSSKPRPQAVAQAGSSSAPLQRRALPPSVGQSLQQRKSTDAPFATSAGAAVPVGPGGRLTDYQATMRVRVRDLNALGDATGEAQQIARSLGGYVRSVDYTAPRGQTGVSYVELRVPVSRVEDALLRLSSLGTVLEQHVATKDLQALLDRQNAQIASLRREIERLVLTLKTPLPPDVRIRLQLQLDEAKQALAARTHRRRSTVREGSFAKVSLELTTEKAALVPPTRGRFGRAFHGALGFLAAAGAIALAVVVAVSPLLLLALVWVVAWRVWRRREERRLLAA
jgi:hypothetical protein